MAPTSPSFKPIRVANVTLSQRVASLLSTRHRSTDGFIPSQLQYYTDKSKVPGTLLITEGTFVSSRPGVNSEIFTDTQVKAWKQITDAVHANNSYIAIEIWSLGRGSESRETDEKSANPNPLIMLATKEIDDIIYRQYPEAARRAIEAGFDFVELHGAHGYSIEQFLSPATNNRRDKYGGSIENRGSFVLNIVDELVKAIGAGKLAVGFSPWNTFLNMRAEEDDIHPIATYGYISSELQRRAREGNELAYIALEENRFSLKWKEDLVKNTFATQIWKGKLYSGNNYYYDTRNSTVITGSAGQEIPRNFLASQSVIIRPRDGFESSIQDRNEFYTRTKLWI